MTAISEGVIATHYNGTAPIMETVLDMPDLTVPDTAEGITNIAELTPKARLLGQLATGEIDRENIDLMALDPNDFTDEEAALITGKPLWAEGRLGLVYHRRNASQLFNLAVFARLGHSPSEPSSMMGKMVHGTYVQQAARRRATAEHHARKRAGLPEIDNSDDLE